MSESVGSIHYDITADTSKLIDQRRTVERETDKMAASFNAITQAVKLYAAALALVKSAQMADDTRLLAARVQVAAGSLEQASAAMAELQRISTRTQTSIEASATVFTRLNSSIKQMGGTQSDTLRITELLGMAVKVSGASAAESASAMTQFGQALGSGKLAGDELRSLLENAPYLMQQLANGLGVPIGALKGLGEQGKLTADVVVTALGKAATTIEADFKRMPQTLAGAFAVATDAAARANEAFDTMTGGSAVLTGVTKGLGDVLDMLASQFKGATTEADKLSRGDTITTWASATTYALSFVADAADFVVRGFRQTGLTIYETAMAAKAAAGGELKEAGERMVDLKNKLLDIGGAAYAGAKMRQQLAALANVPEPDPMDRRASGAGQTPSKLTAPAGPADPKKASAALAYLAKLREATATEYEQIGLIEQEALRKNATMEGLTLADREKAAQLIRQDALNKRIALYMEDLDKWSAIEDERDKRSAEVEKRRTEEGKRAAADRARGIKEAEDAIVGADPVQKIILEGQRKTEALKAAAALDLQNATIYAQALVALEQQTAEQIKAIKDKQAEEDRQRQLALIGSYSSLFGSIADLAKASAGEQSSTYKALFAAQKAFAIASAIINIQKGISDAAAQGATVPQKLAGMALVASSTAGIISTMQGANFGGGRQYGGPTTAGTLYRVNETGAPEMFTAGNGQQFLLPTANGSVTPADQVGGGGGWKIIVNNNAAGVRVTPQVDDSNRTITLAVSEVANQISENSGPVWNALRGATNVQSRLTG
jgi:tape measure domain-containing protein